MKYFVFALGIGFVLDALFGDPPGIPHPVRLIGSLIAFLGYRIYHSKPGESQVLFYKMEYALSIRIHYWQEQIVML